MCVDEAPSQVVVRTVQDLAAYSERGQSLEFEGNLKNDWVGILEIFDCGKPLCIDLRYKL